jgi:thiol:disulfide interchange protein
LAKPAVDGLQRELEARELDMLLLDARGPVGRQLLQPYGVRAVPTLIVFDAAGEPVLRQVGRINSDQVLALIDES